MKNTAGPGDLKPKPSPYPWLVGILLTALTVGALFQGYALTEVAFFRMFGTIGLVIVAYFATRAFYAWQEGDALDRLQAALRELPADFHPGPALRIPRPHGRGHLIVGLTVLGPKGLHLLGIDETRPYVSFRNTLLRWGRSCRDLWTAKRRIQKELDRLGEGGVTAVLVPLYRSASAEETVEGIPVRTPETLSEHLVRADELAAETEMSPRARNALATWLRLPASPVDPTSPNPTPSQSGTQA